jgi:nitrogen fixation NifU-like protein
MLTELLVGRTLNECHDIGAEALLAALDGLPSDKQHCAGFAVRALRNALSEPPDQCGARSP